jgi:hypothetical protein
VKWSSFCEIEPAKRAAAERHGRRDRLEHFISNFVGADFSADSYVSHDAR